MISFSTVTSRNLQDFHHEVREIDACISYQLEEIKNSQQQLYDKIKATQEARCATSLRSGYFLSMTPHNVQSFSQLPFMKSEGFLDKQTLIELPTIGSVRSDIHSFIQSVFEVYPKLPQLFAKLDSKQLSQTLPFLPEGIQIKDFLACSTLPALFGHCWASELRRRYIHFLIEITRCLPQQPITPLYMKNHWLMECIKNYIFAAEIQKFLKISIGDIVLRIIRENIEDEEQLLRLAREIISNMELNLEMFPNDVRLLMKAFTDIFSEQAQKEEMLQYIFLDCILQPALYSPKAYCILPQTFHYDAALEGVNGFHKLIFKFSENKPSSSGYQNAIPLNEYLQRVVDINEDAIEVGGPQITTLMPLLGSHSVVMLFSMTDICLISILIQEVDTNFAKKLALDKPLELTFFRFEAWDLDILGIAKPEIKENVVERAPNTNLGQASAALFKLLTFVQEKAEAPSSLSDFLTFCEQEAILQNDFQTHTYMNHLILKINQVEEKEHCDILPALEDEIRRHQSFVSRNSHFLIQVALQVQNLETEIQLYVGKAEESLPAMYSQILTLFLTRESTVDTILKAKKTEFFTSKQEFMAYLGDSLHKLKVFITPFAEFALNGVANHLHTYMMQHLPFEGYLQYNNSYQQSDQRLSGVDSSVIENVCIAPAPKKVKKIFENKPLFEFAEIQLRNAEEVKLPIESVYELSIAISLIQKMFDLEIGGMPQADEMTPLFNYALLSSSLKAMLSFEKYLEHFLFEMPLNEVKFLSEPMQVALTHFINHVSSLEQIINELS